MIPKQMMMICLPLKIPHISNGPKGDFQQLRRLHGRTHKRLTKVWMQEHWFTFAHLQTHPDHKETHHRLVPRAGAGLAHRNHLSWDHHFWSWVCCRQNLRGAME